MCIPFDVNFQSDFCFDVDFEVISAVEFPLGIHFAVFASEKFEKGLDKIDKVMYNIKAV